MAQSLVTTPPDSAQALQVNGRPLAAMHEQIVGILRNRLGENHGSLLAVPKLLSDGSIAWSTPLGGAVTPAGDLPPDERDKLSKRAERLLDDIRGLSAQLRSEGPSAQVVAQILDSAARVAPGPWLYSVGGKPVLAMWGHGDAAVPAPAATPTPVAPVVAPPPPARDPVIEAAARELGPEPAPPPGPPPTEPGKPRGRWWPWLVLLLLLLALIAWFLYRYTHLADDDALAAQAAQAEQRNKQLEDELAKLRSTAPSRQCVADPYVLLEQQIDKTQDCEALKKMLDTEPLLKNAETRAQGLKDKLQAKIAESCKAPEPPPPPASAPASAPVPAPAASKPEVAKADCPGERPPELTPQFVMVFDASPSMDYSLNASKKEIEAAERAQQLADSLGPFYRGPAPLDAIRRDPHRMTPARTAALDVASHIPADVSTGLVMVDRCTPGARPVAMFPPGERSAFVSAVRSIKTAPISEVSGTPLADGLAKAGRMVDGVKRDANILLISDGEESCQGDPCAVAAALARAKPRLKINVVDITGTGAANCVASATKGTVYTARNAAEITAMMQRASQDAMAPKECKR